MDGEGEPGVEGLFKVKVKGKRESVGRMKASEKADKVRRLDVETEIMNFWNEMLESALFLFSKTQTDIINTYYV